jgi:hypothetical protein
MHMQTLDAEQCICRLAARYPLNTERVFSHLARQQFKAAAAALAVEQQPAMATVCLEAEFLLPRSRLGLDMFVPRLASAS